jgi:hypothetical protein
MASIKLNGEVVPLSIQSQETIGALAIALLPLIAARQGIVGAIGGVVAHGLGQKIAPTDPKIQAALWLLHELGVRSIRIDIGGSQGAVDEVLPEEDRARDTSDPFSPGNIATGRAMAFALSNLATRQFALNGEIREVKLLQREKMAGAMQAIVDMRRLNEPIHLTSTRALAVLIASGAGPSDERVEAVVSLLSDLGVPGITVDSSTNTITFEGPFSEANAAASAYLQGGGAEGVKAARARVRFLNEQAAKASAGGAPGARASAVARPLHAPKPRRRR